MLSRRRTAEAAVLEALHCVVDGKAVDRLRGRLYVRRDRSGEGQSVKWNTTALPPSMVTSATYRPGANSALLP